MAPESATARIFLAACFFLLPIILLSHHVSAATTAASPPLSFSFDFSNTSKYSLQDLRFEGDASLNGDLVDLTSCNSDSTYYCRGRMLYNHPVALYNNNTGEVASFSTTFTFANNLWPNKTLTGDGMTFFLSGYPSSLLPGSSSSVLGLTNDSKTVPSGDDRYIAVEFDTYGNPLDPTGSTDHIVIYLNYLTSVSTMRLTSYSLNGTMTATITFDNATRTLEATLHFDYNHSIAPASVKTQLPDQLDALLPPVVAVGFSAATAGNSELRPIYSWSFNSTMAAAERSTGFNRVPPQGEIFGVKGRQGRVLVIGGLAILSLAVLLGIWLAFSCLRLKRKRDYFGKNTRLQRLEYRDLSNATGRFSDKNIIGAGNFGEVYRGRLAGKDVAVKKILKDSQGKFKDFLAELSNISGTAHKNVVKLEGWCCSISNFMFWWLHRQHVQLFIVYELVPNGNLQEHLYGSEKEVLSWPKRYNIVKGLCAALQYLHHGCEKYILHRDIKPGNILLDKDFNAKLGDFGLSRAAEDSHATYVQTLVAAGTVGYMDPLSVKDTKANLRRSSDVYSFGIVLLEIVHGKFDPDNVRKLHTDEPETFAEDVADQRLGRNFDKVQMERVIVLGLRCSEPVPSNRPSFDGAILQFLEEGGELRPATVHADEPPYRATAPSSPLQPGLSRPLLGRDRAQAHEDQGP